MSAACQLTELKPVVVIDRLNIKLENGVAESSFDFNSESNFGEWCARVKQEDDVDIYMNIDENREELSLKKEDKEDDPGEKKPVLKPRRSYTCDECWYRTRSRKRFKTHYFSEHPPTEDRPVYTGLRNCPRCDMEFTRFCLLRKHYAGHEANGRKRTLNGRKITAKKGTVNKKKRPLRACPYCKHVALSGNLSQHVSIVHKKGKPLSCKHCPFKTYQPRSLKEHTDGKHLKERAISCPKRGCTFTTSYTSSLNSHMVALHSKRKDFPYKCPHCPYRGAQKGTLTRHVQSQHTGERPYKCSECSFSCVHPTALKYHRIGKHSGRKPLKCKFCDYRTGWPTAMSAHVAALHKKVRPYSCPHCSYSSAQSGVLKRHIVAKHSLCKPFQCAECDYSATRAALLDEHFRKKHSDNYKVQCKTCGEEFKDSQEMRRHTIKVHLQRLHKCRFCKFTAFKRGLLREHCVLRHKTRNLRICSQCDDYFTYHPGDLRRHVEGFHQTDKEFRCGHCNYSAKRKSHLEGHIVAIHMKERPFACAACDYRSSQMTLLKKHFKRAHPEPPKKKFPCALCAFSSDRKVNLVQHMKAKH